MSGGYIGTAPADRDPVVGNDTVTTSKIQDDAVTADKLANSINSEIAANTAKVTNATHTGDVTGATALTIAADAVTTSKILDDNVTYAKIQDTTTDNRVLGAATAGEVGEVQVTGDMIAATTITDGNISSSAAIAQSKLSLDITNSEINASAAIALSKLASDPSNASNLASGTVPTARLGSGTANATTFLRGDQSWAEAGGGKILQVVAANKTDKTTISSGSYTAVPGLSITITPSSTSNKIALWAQVSAGEYGYVRWHRDGSQIGSNLGSTISNRATTTVVYLDSPSSTSSLTYQIYGRHYSSSYTFQINYGIVSSDTMFSTVMAMEVEG